ncbi:thioesterase domain-containing protein [Azomonas agilis]|uniref:Thioesterase domain-containing protein n=1 Tax=Azomonas agilis TaxID=116849 RepID=A0A562J097_9GAMM|nr:YiiD C-terminal domain-containing protein [Azomonas agilis]TWH76244.1 thioesterase domain-containing protein [Azomonas agilis]
MSPEQYLNTTFHEQIPLTKALGLKARQWQDQQLQLDIPFAGNTNHTGSMFGGSLYCAAVLAGWGWLTLRQQETGLEGGHIVIQGGTIEYPLPVLEDAIAVCSAPAPEVWQRFEQMYRRHGRARLNLEPRILLADQREAVRFSGQYVLHR